MAFRPTMLMLIAGAMWPAATLMADADDAPEIDIVRIDGTTASGRWHGSPNGSDVVIHTDDGSLNISLHDLATIRFDSLPKPPLGPVVFHLFDGGHLHGELADAAHSSESRRGEDATGPAAPPSDRILGRTALGPMVGFSFDQLAGVRLGADDDFPRAATMFRKALSARLPGQDVLITRSKEEPRALRGRLESFGVTGGTFHFGQRPRTFRIEKIFGIVFAAGVADMNPGQSPVTVTFADGARMAGRILASAACGPGRVKHAVCVDTNIGKRVELSVSDINRIDVRSERVVYISDLVPEKEKVEGLLHQPVAGRTPWPVRVDQSVTTGPLTLNGRTFDKGLGVHSRTELVYRIGGAYEQFVATIGVDDAVRPHGSLVFRVLGRGENGPDSAVLFDSGTVTGMDAPRDIIVELEDTTELTLLVDYGEDLDVGDAAVWGDARLLKAREVSGGDSNE